MEWLEEAPDDIRALPRQHPASWQRVLLNELVAEPGLDLHVIAVRKHFSHDSEFSWRGARFHCLKVPGGMRSLSYFWWETLRIKKTLRHIRPDVIHAWGVERGAALVASRLHYPYLVTVQGLLKWYLQQVRESHFQVVEASLEKPSLHRAPLATTESRFAMNWLRHEYPGLELLQIEHAPDWRFHHSLRVPGVSPIKLLYVGASSDIKGTDILLRGFNKLVSLLDCRLTIVGAGATNYLQQLDPGLSETTRGRITFKNNLTAAEVSDEMSRATMLVFPTRADTSPNAVKEAVVSGLPVVASRVGGIPDYVRHSRNGMLFQPGDVAAFVGAVQEAAKHPLFSSGRVEPACLSELREYLSPLKMKEKFLEAYGKVLSSKKVAQRQTT